MKFWRFDFLVLLGAGVLLAFGLAAIASIEFSQGVSQSVLLEKQGVALVIGLVLSFGAATRHVQFFRAFAKQAYLIGVLLLVLVLFFGRTLNGTTGWFVLGGYAFQPLEFMKIALILRLARYFGEELGHVRDWRTWFKPLGLVGLPAVLVMMQPDLGGALLLLGVAGCLFFLAGLPGRLMGTLAALLVGISGPAWWWLDEGRRARILTFINPALDPLGRGYNILQAQVAIGAGGFWGRSLGGGSQSRLQFLPESQTDFIFAVIGEELGFLGILGLLLALGLLIGRLIALARRAPDGFTSYLLWAIAALFFVQSTTHIGANLALLPATGVPLPLVSYGGTALIVFLILVGMALSAAASTGSPGER